MLRQGMARQEDPERDLKEIFIHIYVRTFCSSIHTYIYIPIPVRI